MQHDAMPNTDNDASKCPPIVGSGLLMERRWNLVIACDAGQSGLALDYSVTGTVRRG